MSINENAPRTDLVKYNTNLLNSALRLTESPKIPDQIRSLVANLIMVITEQDEQISQLYEMKTRGGIQDVYGSSISNEAAIRSSKNDIVKYVQDYLTKNHAEQVSLSYVDAKVRRTVEDVISQFITTNNMSIIENGHRRKVEDTIKEVTEEILGLSVLEQFMVDASDDFDEFVEEIRVDDYNDIRIVRAGVEEKTTASFDSAEHARRIADKLIRFSSSDQMVTLKKENPFVRIRLGATTRVSIMANPVAIRDRNFDDSYDVIHMAIRKQRSAVFTPQDLLSFESINEYGDLLLKIGIGNGVPMIFYGGTGSGKTATMNCYLSKYIKDNSRTITMAEIDEMNLRRLDKNKEVIDKDGIPRRNPMYLKAENSALMWEMPNLRAKLVNGLEGMTGLVNAALTFTPRIIIIQETKGGEIKDLMEAAMSDHQVLTTVHAGDPETLFLRILLMYQQSGANIRDSLVLKQVPIAFKWAVKMVRLPDGKRKVQEITELISYNTNEDTFKKNVLVRYEVRNTVMQDNGKLKVNGSFKNYNFPTLKSMNIIRRNGALDHELNELKTEFDQTKEPAAEAQIVNNDNL